MTETTHETPRIGDFAYQVRIQVWLPLPHAQMLHETALHHYDGRVRASASAGPINAMRNLAQWGAERPADDQPLPHELTASDIDTCMKALERPIAPLADGQRLVAETRKIMFEAFSRANERWRELDDGKAEEARSRAEREALLRLVTEWPRRTVCVEPNVTTANGDVHAIAWRVTQEHPDGRRTGVVVWALHPGEALGAARFLLPYFPTEAFA